MAISMIEGFKIYTNGIKSIIINSDRIDECMQVYTENHLDGVAITTSHDYKLQNIDFLTDYPKVKRLSISDGIKDISAIHSLRSLEFLIVSGKSRKIDYSYFPSLKELIADWSSLFFNMDQCKSLKRLSFYNYNPKAKDCSSISNISWVEKLEIIRSPINTLTGLEYFNQLKELQFSYCSKLETLCCMEESKETLVSLLFDHCKSIKNPEYVSQFRNMNTLAYNNGLLQSIKFIKKIAALKSFRFVGTDVIDGDMTPCIGLKYVGFSNKKHFSHTVEEIQSLTKA